MVALNRNLFQNCYFVSPFDNSITAFLMTQKLVDSKNQEMQKIISLSLILHYVHYCHPNYKNISSRYKFMCGCECCISAKNINSSLLSCCDRYLEKNARIKSKILKIEGPVKKQTAYMKHIKLRSYHMGVIFTRKHLTWKRQQCVRIYSQIMNYHTENVSCNIVINVQA